MVGFGELRTSIIDGGLCVRCGTCAACCPAECIAFTGLPEECIPTLAGTCLNCGLCMEVCPGRAWPRGWNDTGIDCEDPMLGDFRSIFTGHALDGDVRARGASGGMVTALLIQLLEEDLIDAAVVLGFEKDRPWIPDVMLVQDKIELIRAAQSKYFVYPQNLALKKIRENTVDRVAYVGLPCQVHGIRNAMSRGVPGTEKIRFIIGLYCGNNLYFKATESLLKRFGFKHLNRISEIAYREGPHPGHFVVKGSDGKKASLDKFTFNYLSFFYTPMRCLTCIDQTNELADISVGDAWRGTFVEAGGSGSSVIIVRNGEMSEILRNGQGTGRYNLSEISSGEAIRMHANMLDNKKTGAFARMKMMRWFGFSVPSYEFHGPEISKKRLFLEWLNLLTVTLCSTRAARQAVSLIPLGFLRPLLVFIRGTWRKRTQQSL